MAVRPMIALVGMFTVSLALTGCRNDQSWCGGGTSAPINQATGQTGGAPTTPANNPPMTGQAGSAPSWYNPPARQQITTPASSSVQSSSGFTGGTLPNTSKSLTPDLDIPITNSSYGNQPRTTPSANNNMPGNPIATSGSAATVAATLPPRSSAVMVTDPTPPPVSTPAVNRPTTPISMGMAPDRQPVQQTPPPTVHAMQPMGEPTITPPSPPAVATHVPATPMHAPEVHESSTLHPTEPVGTAATPHTPLHMDTEVHEVAPSHPGSVTAPPAEMHVPASSMPGSGPAMPTSEQPSAPALPSNR
jgi:hypothetical protein